MQALPLLSSPKQIYITMIFLEPPLDLFFGGGVGVAMSNSI